MNENGTTQLICIAAIAGAFGIKGEVKLKSFTDDPLSCVDYGPLRDKDGNIVLSPKKPRLVKKFVAVTAKEVTTREQAEALKSTKLYVPRENLPLPEEEEFYYSDLIGLKVETVDGTPKGRVKAVHDFGAGDILEIQAHGQKDWYHPFTKAAVPTVDIKGRRVVINIIEADAVEQDEDGSHI